MFNGARHRQRHESVDVPYGGVTTTTVTTTTVVKKSEALGVDGCLIGVAVVVMKN